MHQDNPPQPSGLLALPFELRQQIYTHIFDTFALSIDRRTSKAPYELTPYKSSSTSALNVTLVNHQIRHESLAILHKQPKPLIFQVRNHTTLLIRGYAAPNEQLPSLLFTSHTLAASIRTLIIPTRCGDRRLLSSDKATWPVPLLPNLRTLGICRAAVGGGTDKVWRRGSGSEATRADVRAWMTSLITGERFLAGLYQSWLLKYVVDGARKGKVRIWCRVIATSEELGQDQAVWVDLDRRMEAAGWVWCVPTRRKGDNGGGLGMGGGLESGVRADRGVGLDPRTYSPLLEDREGRVDAGLWDVVNWWNPAEESQRD
jgi:hypothetical protein